jgi:hypothetical protein
LVIPEKKGDGEETTVMTGQQLERGSKENK